MEDITIVNFTLPTDLYGKVLPLNCIYLISALENEGYNVDFRDYQLNKFRAPHNIDNITSFLNNSSDIIGISCMSNLLPFLILSIKKIKSENPEKTIIFGGSGPGGVAKEILERFPFVDIIVNGEGEKTIVDLLTHIIQRKNLRDVKGITYSFKNKIFVNPPRPRINNLDEIPLSTGYDKINLKDYSTFPIYTSRGCPYNCIFCESPTIWNRRIVYRNVDNIVDEILLATDKSNFNKFVIIDEGFVLNKKHVFEFCDKILKNKIGIEFAFYGRVDSINEFLMKKISKSGGSRIYYGIESGSNKILYKINKKINIKDAEKIIQKSLKYFEEVVTSFIWGFPFESLNDFMKTVNFVKKISNDKIMSQINLLSPAPNSFLYKKYKNKIIFDGIFSLFSITLETPNLKSNIKKKELANVIKRGNEILRPIIYLNYKITELVKKYPDVFPSFYHYKTEDFHKKLKILNDFHGKPQKNGKC